MCELAPRSWRTSVRPTRVALTLAAIAAVVAGVVVGGLQGLILVAISAALLLWAVVLPVVREVEFGLPYAVKVVAAVEDRETKLRAQMGSNRAELELWCQLMCDDAERAASILAAAWSRTASEWRGPIHAGIRVHVLCLFVHLLLVDARWGPNSKVADAGPLSELGAAERAVVVLSEFAGLPTEVVGRLTGRSSEQVHEALRHGEDVLEGHLGAAGGSS